MITDRDDHGQGAGHDVAGRHRRGNGVRRHCRRSTDAEVETSGPERKSGAAGSAGVLRWWRRGVAADPVAAAYPSRARPCTPIMHIMSTSRARAQAGRFSDESPPAAESSPQDCRTAGGPVPISAHPILVSPDVERLRAFYGPLLGADVAERFPAEGPVFYLELRVDAFRLGLTQVPDAPVGEPGRVLLSIDVPDVDALLPQVAGLGGRVTGGAAPLPRRHAGAPGGGP